MWLHWGKGGGKKEEKSGSDFSKVITILGALSCYSVVLPQELEVYSLIWVVILWAMVGVVLGCILILDFLQMMMVFSWRTINNLFFYLANCSQLMMYQSLQWLPKTFVSKFCLISSRLIFKLSENNDHYWAPRYLSA